MSTDGEESTPHRRKRKVRRLQNDSPASTSSGSPIIGTSSRLRRRTNILEISQSENSDSSEEEVVIKRKKVCKLTANPEYSSEDNSSPISHRPMAFRVRMQQVIDSDSEEESESDGSDIICPRRVGGRTSFIPSESEEWETDNSDTQEAPDKASECDGAKAKIVNSDSSDSDGQSEKCPICLLSFKLQVVGIPENCEHTFCLECIQEWSKNMNTCPVDRKEYNGITVKKCLNGKYIKKIPIEKPQTQDMAVDIIEDLTFCELCGSNSNEDRLLLCDGCDLGFHLYCLDPPLDEVPDGLWYCAGCYTREIQEVQSDDEPLLRRRSEDMPYDFGRSSRRASRLIPRTRQAELVRRRVENTRTQRRLQYTNLNEPSTSSGRSSRPRVSSTTNTVAPKPVRRRKKPRKKRKTAKYTTVWVLNEFGEAVAQKKKATSKRKKKKRYAKKRRSSPANMAQRSTKHRLSSQLGICALQHADQILPDVRVTNGGNNIRNHRYQAGIPNIDLFGTTHRLDDYVPSGGEDEDTGVDTLLARRTNVTNPLRRVMRQKAVLSDTPTVSSSTDILGSIMQSQEILLSKSTVLSVVDSSGKLKFENNRKKEPVNNNNPNNPDLNSNSSKPDFNSFTVRETPWNGRHNSGGYRQNYRSNYWQNNRNQNWQNNSNRDYQDRYSGSNFNQGPRFGGNHSQGREDFHNDIPQDYTQRTLCEAEMSQDEDKDKNTPDSNTPTNDAEVDIYCDMESEMVSTSHADDRPPSPPLPMADPTVNNDEEDNDSESGMVIDTERYTEEPVSSTADTYNPEQATYSPDNPTYSPDQPTYSPGQPTYSPGQPTYSPGQPTYSPAPNYSSQQPTYSPGQPMYSPGQTSYSPGEPTASPSKPNYLSEEPTCSPQAQSVESPPSESQGLAVGFDKLQQELASGYESLQREIASGYDELQKEFASGFKEFQLHSAASVDSAIAEETKQHNPDLSGEKDIMDSTEPDSFSNDIQPGATEEIGEPQEIVLDIPVPPEIDNENIPYPPELDSLTIPYPPEPKNDSGNDKSRLDRSSKEDDSPTIFENLLKSPSEPDVEPYSATGSEEFSSRLLSEVDISNFTNPPALDTSDLLKIDIPKLINDEDELSNDGCPNFSIYSKQSKTVALTTDISMPGSRDGKQPEQILGDIDPITDESRSQPASPQRVTVEKTGTDPRLKKKPPFTWNLGALYSDSEDETVVKKTSTFGITDLKDMTEEILSEEERSYTPVLQERSKSKERLDNLGTEMISDDDKNDFDESQELKMVSDADALEINAKESEIDFTRPDEFEEGEIIDKNKLAAVEEAPEPGTPEKKSKKEKKVDKDVKKKKKDKTKDKENPENSANKENVDVPEEIFRKLSKHTKDRNYRDKDKNDSKEGDREKSRSKSPETTDKEHKKKKEKRKELERYNVRAIIAEKPRPPPKDQFGRDVRISPSRSRSYTPPLAQTPPAKPKGTPSPVRAPTPVRRKSRSLSRGKTPPRRHSPKRRSRSRSKSKKRNARARPRMTRSRGRKRERSKTKKRKESGNRNAKRRRSRDKGKKRRRSRSRGRSRSRSISARRRRGWSPSLSRSITPPLHHASPSWTPPRNQNLTVILNNEAAKKKRDKRNKDKRTRDSSTRRRRRDRERTPPPSKEVFASGDNILVSVSFNNENETREVRDNRKRNTTAEKNRERRNKNRADLSGIKPVAIIDLDRSPFQELPASPKDVIILSDSDNNETEAGNVQNNICDSSQQVASPEVTPSYSMGPKTPPEPSVKFALNPKPAQLRAINNPLHDPLETIEEEPPEDISAHKGPNTPPEEPPTSPPSSPDAYDPFEPTKSRSPSPEAGHVPDENDERPIQNLIDNTSNMDLETTGQTPDIIRSLTPPMPDIQPADSQSSVQEIIESSSPGNQLQQVPSTKPVGQTIPFSSVQTTLVSSTPISSTITVSRINILSSSLITQSSAIPQRIVLPQVKSSPVKIPPTKAVIKSTPIKPLQTKPANKKFSGKQNGSSLDEINLDFESPYSPGSSDYEDLFEPPSEPPKSKSSSKAKAGVVKKGGSVFDHLFGSPTYNKKAKKSGGGKKGGNKTKHVGVKIDDDSLKILEEMPNSAVEMQVKDKFLKKLNRQERVVEEVKLVLKPFYNKKRITKAEYKDIMRRAVPKICHNKSGEINPIKIRSLIEAYVKKLKHSKKVTSSSSLPQKNITI